MKQHPLPSTLVLLLMAANLAGCVTANPAVQALVEGVDEADLRQHVVALTTLGPRPVGNVPITRRTTEYITRQLQNWGYEVTLEPTAVRSGDFEHYNVLAELPGRESDRIVELGAHYDTVPGSPGADDNTSGIAGVLEAARILQGRTPRRTIRFCFFAAEEGGLRGSRAHVAKIQEDADRRVEGIVVLEMIGYASSEPGSQSTPVRVPLIVSPPRTGDFILVVGNFSSGGIGNRFLRAARTYVPALPLYDVNRLGGFFSDAARSDHYPYWEAGLRGIMISDTANFRNPNYHRPTDTIETLDFAFMTKVTRATIATLVDWAGLEVE